VVTMKQGVALTGCNCTGLPCSVGRPTAHQAPSRQRYRQRRQWAKQYWPIWQASNKTMHSVLSILLNM